MIYDPSYDCEFQKMRTRPEVPLIRSVLTYADGVRVLYKRYRNVSYSIIISRTLDPCERLWEKLINSSPLVDDPSGFSTFRRAVLALFLKKTLS
jgi:hypothetical protein